MLEFDTNGYNEQYNVYKSRYYARLARNTLEKKHNCIYVICKTDEQYFRLVERHEYQNLCSQRISLRKGELTNEYYKI